jgi:class 3 adenylate cyclase
MSSSEVLSMAELLQLHPWPADLPADLKDQKRLEWLWHFDLPGDPKWLWSLIADTSRLNRALGFAEMHFEDRGEQRWGTAKNGGVAHEWLEVPWNWVQGEWLTCTRLYTKGFARAMFAIHRLQPIEGGARIYLYFGAIPRGVTGGLALRVGFPTLEKAYARVLPAMALDKARRRPAILDIPPPQLSSEATQRLADGRKSLVAAGLQTLCVDKLLDWIATGDEQDLYRIQIRERARVWQVDEHDLLRVALHATRIGILNLSWDTVCPHCRGVKEERAALADIVHGDRCDTCDVTIDLLEPNAVEVSFHVHSTIREIAERTFCSAEPATKDHIAVQVAVAPGGTLTVKPGLRNGRYRVRTIGLPEHWYFDANESLERTELSWIPRASGEVVTAHGDSAVALHNPSATTKQCVIEHAAWKDHALGPGALLSFADFRDVFSTDFVQADVRISVGQQTILFTDVVGSTAFYEAQGDPTAFVEIKKHFDDVFALLATHNGACIKTIGDAVMAAFVDPVDALKCCAAIHQRFGPTNTKCPLRLRISLNTGPCIAVKFSSGMDYFGGTVNIAAKLQSLAETWQVAMSESTYQAAGVMAYLASVNASQVRLQYMSKAMTRPIGVVRWDVYG